MSRLSCRKIKYNFLSYVLHAFAVVFCPCAVALSHVLVGICRCRFEIKCSRSNRGKTKSYIPKSKFAGPLAQSVSDNGPLFPSTHQPINSSIQPINPSTHRLIDSTHQPIDESINVSMYQCSVFSAFQLIDSTRQLVNSSIQLINSSTHQPMALRHFLTRPGGLRAARLNPPPATKWRDERRVGL